MKLLIFGGSIVWGAWDRELGWAYRIKKYCDNKTLDRNFEYYGGVSVLGISGDTTDDLLNRFKSETERRISSTEENYIMFVIGINDSLFEVEQNQHQVSLEQFTENIETLILQAKTFTKNIIFVGLASVDESKVNPIPWHKSGNYNMESVKKYDGVIETICEKEKLDFVKLQDLLDNSDLEDGLHPNTQGHEKIFNEVKGFLESRNIV